MKKILNFIYRKLDSILSTKEIRKIEGSLSNINEVQSNILIDEYLIKNLFNNSNYINSKKITHFHRSVYTQNGEDGIIEEVFKRIGITNKYFVEFGVHGVKNNSTFLLVKGWTGLWIGGSQSGEILVKKKFYELIENKKLIWNRNWISKDNIEDIFLINNVPFELDFLSIDLDGNDFWIWDSIIRYRPRLVAIEYNATFPPDVSWVMKYNSHHGWDQTSYFGSSLKALEILGKEKGYSLIGCDFSGCNAFFIRSDLNLSLFDEPFTAEHHYEPPRYFLKKPSGHKQGFGPFEIKQ